MKKNVPIRKKLSKAEEARVIVGAIMRVKMLKYGERISADIKRYIG